MPIFGGKEDNVFKAIDEHLEAVGLTIKKLYELMETYLAGDIEKAEVLMKEVENQERVADELRREIEAMLYQGAFLPVNRGDYAKLSELIDSVADAAESAAHALILAKPKTPPDLKKEILDLLNASLETYKLVEKSVKMLNTNVDGAIEYAKKTELAEEDADKIEYTLLRKVFESESITTFAKFIWNQVVTKIGDIADRAEDASDQVLLIALKRRG
ncbi:MULTISPECIES: TIGR00153 family protein [Thermococcus]|uniref:Phosphate transport system regulator PhoU like protein n=2 Tax=Thermococcus sibiricus TaxID=172049 RepID=C6A379_THESM|nr:MULTISPECIES: TIGR00153 family protein [Thermococcus]KUK28143.1 MAG: Phosphate transport system regulator PhoU like protein [Thermococcus sp. 40_45]HII67244.1 TIGR00153 family protein [Thermococcaceae archaeon]ACS90074.1 Phosphate transport system regulator PhoU like protein [Thermococcus sibiricus MM 739]KUK18627.1 MAG: Phosphate transport system regulator PhoU like protein [Thermococcus sibiricus]MBC7095997.1 TIGR00153 family protein [Thermococcus sp.]